MILGATGHRLLRLIGNDVNIQKLREYFAVYLTTHKPSRVITGVAIGFDMELSEVVLNLNMQLTAAVPFEGQEKRWPMEYKVRYRKILDHPNTIKMIISTGTYTNWKYIVRDRWIVDSCDKLLAGWDGAEEGGTYRTIEYAKGRREIDYIDLKKLAA